MDLRYSIQEEAFRSELRAWLADVVPTVGPPPSTFDWPARRAYDTAWQRMLFDAGYAGIDWPTEGGGRGASPVEQLVYLEELERAHAPYVGVNFVGLLHAGPTIAAEGTPEQRARFLPPILRGDEVWCQGFSEPDAGSDLASLRTRAVRDGDEYVVTGSKIWTSHAEVADVCEMLVRTGPEGSRHGGITWLAMPMDLPGIDIRPLKTIVGSSEFAELYLEDVRVPVANRVGEENDGWRVTMVTLSFERGTAFVGELLQSMELLRGLRDLARRTGAWDDDEIRRRVGHFGAELDALWALTKRNVSQAARSGVPGIGGSVFKLAFSELRQRLAELGMELVGDGALSWDELPGLDGVGTVGNAEVVDTWVNSFSRTIAAGTSQIQRNIVAERILGMPQGLTMDFELSDDEQALAEAMRALCAGRFPLQRFRVGEQTGTGADGAGAVLDPGGWAELGRAGVFVVQKPEDEGGTGLGMAAAAVVFEELGRALVPGPLAASNLASGLVDGADDGTAIIGAVRRPRPARGSPGSGAPGGVEGLAPVLVGHLSSLSTLLVHDVDGLFAVDPAELQAEPLVRSLDPLTPLWRVDHLPQGAPVPGADVDRWRRDATVLLAAQAVGLAAATLELAVAYAGQRQQFGKPIGSFQAVKHLCADMLVRTETARAAVYAAAVTIDHPEAGDPERAAAGAGLLATEAAIANGRSCIQVHGGMGFTWEVPAHLYLMRARMIAAEMGPAAGRALVVAERY